MRKIACILCLCSLIFLDACGLVPLGRHGRQMDDYSVLEGSYKGEAQTGVEQKEGGDTLSADEFNAVNNTANAADALATTNAAVLALLQAINGVIGCDGAGNFSAASIYTKDETDNLLDGKQNAMSVLSQARAEDLSDVDPAMYSPQRAGQTALQVLEDTFGYRTYLTSEPADEWVGQTVYIAGYTAGYDPADQHALGHDAAYIAFVKAIGTPWTLQVTHWFTGGEWVLLLGQIPMAVHTYASTDTIQADYLYDGQINNYGQGSDSILTLTAAAAGMNAIFEFVDNSNSVSIAPPSGAAFMYVDSTGTIDTGFSANEKIVCTTPDIGEELRITTYQTGASSYAYKIVQTIGDSCAEETP